MQEDLESTAPTKIQTPTTAETLEEALNLHPPSAELKTNRADIANVSLWVVEDVGSISSDWF